MVSDSRHPRPVSLSIGETLSLRTAARQANVSEGTISRWARKFGIGRQLSTGSPWRISGPALRMIIAADPEALEALRAGDIDNELVRPYLASGSAVAA